jgi:2-oxoglutarate dehydrogenase E1 component
MNYYFNKTVNGNFEEIIDKVSKELEKEGFGVLTDIDLKATFKAGEILGIGETTLEEIIKHLESIYCDSIGIEYMYIRKPDEIQWIQQKLNVKNLVKNKR